MKRVLLLTCILMLAVFSAAWAQQRKISGRVTDNKGNPLPATTIQVAGTTNGTTTDADGKFEINAKPGQNLEITSIGFLKQVLQVPDESKSLHIVLKTNTNMLNETVVTALGISRKERQLGYAVTTVQGSDIVKTSPTNFVSALYGRVPGMSVNSNPGGANSAVSVQIRG